MKYQYQIVDNTTNLVLFDAEKENLPAWETEESCRTIGETQQQDIGLSETSYIRIIPIPENITEEDELAGHCYPGHEMWED